MVTIKSGTVHHTLWMRIIIYVVLNYEQPPELIIIVVSEDCKIFVITM